jgi:beta-glucosidase
MKRHQFTCCSAAFAVTSALSFAHAQDMNDPAESSAAETERLMTNEERAKLAMSLMYIDFPGAELPDGAISGAGYIEGIPRLGVPALRETDASLGITWLGGSRHDGGTALPSATAQGSTWNAALIERGGEMIGSEARLKGFNVLLAGGINLMRDPRNGRTFEYMGEDPYHSAILGAAAVRGIQSQNVISTLKHFAINPQETGRHFMNVKIDEASLRESDLLAFEIAIEKSRPGAIMCAYNRLNGPLSCGSEFLLTEVLRDDWNYKGFVMSDWGAVEALDFALAGLDQQSGAQMDEDRFFGDPLFEAASTDERYQARLEQIARNVLYAIHDVGLGESAPEKTDKESPMGEEVALRVAQEGIVLLKNEGNALPLSPRVTSIAVIGGHADAGTLSGGGSSRVMSDEGPAISIPFLRGGSSNFASSLDHYYHRSAPLAAIEEAASSAHVTFRDGRYRSDAARAAEHADVAIVFATQYMTEGFDAPDLSLPYGQDELIAAVAAANPNTIVVLQTGGPVAMPWLDDVAAVMEAWYPGAKGGEAIADILFGDVNPSGHLPITFPGSLEQLPRPELDGLGTVEPSYAGVGTPGQTLEADYTIEGSDIGYRWFARESQTALFPFGHGLSYSVFAHDKLKLSKSNGQLSARFELRNTGGRAGADVAQLYLVSAPDGKKQRLVGFAKEFLEPGEEASANLSIDYRLLGEWENDGWTLAGGRYTFALGQSAEDLGLRKSITLPDIRLDASGKPDR